MRGNRGNDDVAYPRGMQCANEYVCVEERGKVSQPCVRGRPAMMKSCMRIGCTINDAELLLRLVQTTKPQVTIVWINSREFATRFVKQERHAHNAGRSRWLQPISYS